MLAQKNVGKIKCWQKKRLAKKNWGAKKIGPLQKCWHKKIGSEIKSRGWKKIGAEFFFWYETSYQVEIRLHTENNVVYRKSA